MRRTAAFTAALIAGSAALAPAVATADTTPANTTASYLQFAKLLNGNIATLDCNVLGTALRATGTVNAETTRSGLVENLNTTFGESTALRLATASTINTVADRALQCGVVKADPVTPASKALEIASKLSSNAGLPDARTLAALSSK